MSLDNEVPINFDDVIVIGGYAHDRKQLCEALRVQDVRYDAANQTLHVTLRGYVDFIQLELGFTADDEPAEET